MLRKGFTLIELLVVITIIAILAGAAIPYVQDYVADARYSKAKSDMNEIANGIARYELDRGVYTDTTTASLVGPYIAKSVADPWGGVYHVSPASSTIYSGGEDGDVNTVGDNLVVSFRPVLSLSRVYYEDSSGDGVVGAGDSLIFKFTRPIDSSTFAAGDQTELVFDPSDSVTFSAAAYSNATMTVKMTMNGATSIIPGKTTVRVKDGNAIADPAGVTAVGSDTVPIKAR